MAIEVGSKLQGKVTGITKFGAFVQLPDGQTGLVHISEVADTYVTDIHQHLKVGDTVTVKVLNVRDGKIGLSIKKAVDRPDRPERPVRPDRQERSPRTPRERTENFEEKMNRFLKDSEDRQSSLRKKWERKGRGN